MAGVSAKFGLTPLCMSRGRAALLLDSLQTARKAAKGHKETLRIPGCGKEQAAFYGWDTYNNVACAKHEPRQQAKHTCVLFRGETAMLQRLSAALPGFSNILALAQHAEPDMEIALVHALFQDSAQARFHWHRDNEVEGSEDVMRTLVILLKKSIYPSCGGGHLATYSPTTLGGTVATVEGVVHFSIHRVWSTGYSDYNASYNDRVINLILELSF